MSTALNCRQGDKALIIKAPSSNPWMLGLTVTCLYLQDTPTTKPPYRGRVWRVDRGLVWQHGTDFVSTPHIADACLRPVRPETVMPLSEPRSLLAQVSHGQVKMVKGVGETITVTGIPDGESADLMTVELLQAAEDVCFAKSPRADGQVIARRQPTDFDPLSE